MRLQDKFTSWEKRFNDTHDDYFRISFKYPDVRLNEFISLREMAKREFKKILEFPADGMMLNVLYPEAHIDRAELIEADFSSYPNPPMITDFSFSNIEHDTYEAIMSITPMHHSSCIDQENYLSAAYKCLKNNGILVLGEVIKGSKEAKFLDGFVNTFSYNGHEGNYPSQALKAEIEKVGFLDVEVKVKKCPWVFQDEDQMIIFVTKIFGLKQLKPSFLLSNLETMLGLYEHNNKIYLDWELIYFKGMKL
jgi:SAM-dependent methyltransferase